MTIHGDARITEGGAAELLQQLADTYVGPDVEVRSLRSPIADHRPAGDGVTTALFWRRWRTGLAPSAEEL